MRQRSIQYILAMLIFGGALLPGLRAQFTVGHTGDAEYLVKDVLRGDGIAVRKIVFHGNPEAIGAFEGLSLNGMPESGIILSTGKAETAIGPNESPRRSDVMNTRGDTYIDAITRNRSFDAAVLEFDILPAMDSVTIRFVFASEEYNDYVGKDFQDAFAITVGGPGLGRGINLGTLENGQAININTVNVHTNRRYYLDNNPYDLNGNRKESLEAKLSKECLATLEYDGMTRVIEAGFRTKPREPYHVKIVIADVGDGQIDSALLLESGSMESREQLWRVRKREAIRAQQVADSLAAVKAYEDSLAREQAIRDSIEAANAPADTTSGSEDHDTDIVPEIIDEDRHDEGFSNEGDGVTFTNDRIPMQTVVKFDQRLETPISAGNKAILDQYAEMLRGDPDLVCRLYSDRGPNEKAAAPEIRAHVARLYLLTQGVSRWQVSVQPYAPFESEGQTPPQALWIDVRKRP